MLPFPGLDRHLDLEAVSDYLSLLYIPRGKDDLPAGPKVAAGDLSDRGRGGKRLGSLLGAPLRARADHESRQPSGSRSCSAIGGSSVGERCFRSDVPRGGLDSSAVVGRCAPASSPVVTASIGFADPAFDELSYARLAARHFGTDHREEVVAPGAAEAVKALSWYYDEPFGDSSAIPTYRVSQLARQRVKVVLSGDGGDESFAGYRRYWFDVRENRLRNAIPAPVRGAVFGCSEDDPKADPTADLPRKAFSARSLAARGSYLHSVSGCTKPTASCSERSSGRSRDGRRTCSRSLRARDTADRVAHSTSTQGRICRTTS